MISKQIRANYFFATNLYIKFQNLACTVQKLCCAHFRDIHHHVSSYQGNCPNSCCDKKLKY